MRSMCIVFTVFISNENATFYLKPRNPSGEKYFYAALKAVERFTKASFQETRNVYARTDCPQKCEMHLDYELRIPCLLVLYVCVFVCVCRKKLFLKNEHIYKF